MGSVYACLIGSTSRRVPPCRMPRTPWSTPGIAWPSPTFDAAVHVVAVAAPQHPVERHLGALHHLRARPRLEVCELAAAVDSLEQLLRAPRAGYLSESDVLNRSGMAAPHRCQPSAEARPRTTRAARARERQPWHLAAPCAAADSGRGVRPEARG
eukprot:5188613-Prymnesium_polylepis.1